VLPGGNGREDKEEHIPKRGLQGESADSCRFETRLQQSLRYSGQGKGGKGITLEEKGTFHRGMGGHARSFAKRFWRGCLEGFLTTAAMGKGCSSFDQSLKRGRGERVSWGKRLGFIEKNISKIKKQLLRRGR